MSGLGQNRKSSMRAYDFRCLSNSGHPATAPACPFGAKTGSVSSPLIAHHTLAGIAAGHLRELAFEGGGGGPAVQPFLLGGGGGAADNAVRAR
jgi:hypothetical protein